MGFELAIAYTSLRSNTYADPDATQIMPAAVVVVRLVINQACIWLATRSCYRTSRNGVYCHLLFLFSAIVDRTYPYWRWRALCSADVLQCVQLTVAQPAVLSQAGTVGMSAPPEPGLRNAANLECPTCLALKAVVSR